MSIIAKISVGDIFFYEVDSKPTHSAPKGSVAILNSNNLTTLYKNNDGGNTWLKTIKPAYGNLYINNNATTLQWGDFDLGAFYSFEDTNSWVADNTNQFIKNTDATFGDTLQYTGTTDIRAVIKLRTTTRGGTGKWLEFEHAPAKNFTIGGGLTSGFHTLDNGGTNGVGCVTIDTLSTNDEISVGFSPIRRENGGPPAQRAFINRHSQLGVFKIDEGIQEEVFTENWESSGFTENSWTVVNDTTNVWVVGQAENNGGTSSAYVSDDGGTSASYDVNTANVSHFYKDFTLPTGNVTLTFDWKCQGENTAGNAVQYDYGTVVIIDTTTTPVAGTEVSTTQATGGGNGRIGADTNDGKFNLGYGTTPGTTWNTETIDLSDYDGQTKRLVFTWVNDGSVGADPPFIIDNIQIISIDW